MNNRINEILNEPITHSALILLGYSYHLDLYYCPPLPAGGGDYRIDHEPTHIKGGVPVKGTEVWRAYLTSDGAPTIRTFKTIQQLNNFHKGICDSNLPSP